ncbi:MAG: phosphotransferase family protein [Burkholderiaceae bacterium]
MTTGTADSDAVLARRIEQTLRELSGAAQVRVVAIKRFTVGFSWRTLGVVVRGLPLRGDPAQEPETERELILRLGSDAGLFAPYSSRPEALALRALEGSAVPVPRVYWASDDAQWLGAPFMFCEKVDGSAVVPWVPPGSPPLPDDVRKSLGTDFIDALAALHRLPWQDRPIAELERLTPGITASSAALLNVEFWERQIERWALRSYPLAQWGIRWLKTHAPPAPRVAVVHGDYRTGNFLERGGRITAMLDWELVHLGDPHEDIGWLTLPMYMGGSPHYGRLCEPAWFYARYAERSGIAVSAESVHYYQVFSFLKLAATHMAAARCFEDARSNDMRMPAMGSQIATCLRQMDKTIERGPAPLPVA